MIRFFCHRCSKRLKANSDIIGRKVKCKGCQTVVLVPDPTITDENGVLFSLPKLKRQESTTVDNNPDIEWDQPEHEREQSELARDGAKHQEPTQRKPRGSATVQPPIVWSSYFRLALLSFLICLFVLGASSLYTLWKNQPIVYSEDFKQVSLVKQHARLIADLKRKGRYLKVKGEALVQQGKATPEEIESFQGSLELVNTEAANREKLDEAYLAFQSEGEDGSFQVLRPELDRIKSLVKDLEKSVKKYSD